MCKQLLLGSVDLFVDVLFWFFVLFLFLIHMCILWIYVMYSESCLSIRLAVQPSVFRGKNFNVGHYRQTIQPNFVMPAMTSTIFYPFHWPWPCLGVTRSAQSKTYWLHFLTLFIWPGRNFMWWRSSLSRTSWDHFWVRFFFFFKQTWYDDKD